MLALFSLLAMLLTYSAAFAGTIFCTAFTTQLAQTGGPSTPARCPMRFARSAGLRGRARLRAARPHWRSCCALRGQSVLGSVLPAIEFGMWALAPPPCGRRAGAERRQAPLGVCHDGQWSGSIVVLLLLSNTHAAMRKFEWWSSAARWAQSRDMGCTEPLHGGPSSGGKGGGKSRGPAPTRFSRCWPCLLSRGDKFVPAGSAPSKRVSSAGRGSSFAAARPLS